MAIENIVWEDPVVVAHRSSGYGGADAQVAGSLVYTPDIDMETSGHSGISVEISAKTGVSPTDDLLVYVYGRLDSSWDGDEQSLNATAIPILRNTGTGYERIRSFVLEFDRIMPHMRIGMVRSGSTNTYDVQVRYKRFRRSIA